MRALGVLARLALPLVLAGVGLVATPAPASAAVTGSTSSDDVVLFPECRPHAIDYDLEVSPGTVFWRLRVEVVDPDGFTSEGNVVNSRTGPTSGTFTVTFCGSETPGTYTVRASGFTQLVPLVQLPFALPDSHFEVRRAATRTRLAKKRLGPGRYQLTSRVASERPGGDLSPATGLRVRLERLVDGTWRPIRGKALEVHRGRAVTTLAVGRTVRVRAVTLTLNNYAGSQSDPVRLRG